MATIVPILLPVREDLDTANPVTDRRPGVLVKALDVHPRYWGPRQGTKAFTRIWEAPGTASLYDTITLDGSDTKGRGVSREEGFRNLGTKFTLDLGFRLTDAAHATGKDEIGLYRFRTGVSSNYGIVQVYVYGPNHASAGKLRVEITTTSAPGTADSLVGITGATTVTIGSTQITKHHVRVVRDGSTATLYLDGVSDGSTTSLSSTHGVLGNGSAEVLLGAYATTLGATDVTFKGVIHGAVLRDGAYGTAPIEASMPANPWARHVHHYYLGRAYALGGSNHYFDASRFNAHARIVGSGASLTASNDNTFPAPSPIQGMRSFTTRTGRTATAVVAGGVLSYAVVS